MSITNFYYYDKLKKCIIDSNEPPLHATTANLMMKIVKTGRGIPISIGESLVDIFTDEHERLFTIPEGLPTLLRARIEGEPFDLNIVCDNSQYSIYLPEYAPPDAERIAELPRLVAQKRKASISECADAYRRLISGMRFPCATGAVYEIMLRITDIVNDVGKNTIRIPFPKGNISAAIKYSQNDFFRLIVSAVAVCFAMAGRTNVKMSFRIGNRVAAFGAAFSPRIPAHAVAAITNGQYDSHPFDSEYGSIFMMLSYIKRLCLLYGYALGVEKQDPRSLSFTLTFPLTAVDDMPLVDLMEGFDTESAIRFAKALLSE